MTSSKSSQFLLFSGALGALLLAHLLQAAPVSSNSTSVQAQGKTEEKSQIAVSIKPPAVQSQTVPAATEAAVVKMPAASQQQPAQPAAAAAAAATAAPESSAAAAAAVATGPATDAPLPQLSSADTEAETVREATGLDLIGGVVPQRYDDLDLLMGNWNDAESVPEPVETDDDDEAMLQQLFTRDSRPSDVDLSPRAMAQYLMLTDDFDGVQQAIQDLVSTGLLTENEADSYRDEVSLEYASMTQQKFLPQRAQRDIYRLENAYDTDVRNGAEANDYVEYDNNDNVMQPTLPADELPISAELAQLDASVLEELLRQQQQQQRLQQQQRVPSRTNYVSSNNDDEELFLRAVEPDTARDPISEELDQSAADDATNYDGQQASLEAELESLPVEVVTEKEKVPTDHLAVGVDGKADETETELEQVGKLLKNDRTKEQGGWLKEKP